MKRWIATVLAAAACISLAACAKQPSGKQPAAADVVKAVADQMTFKDNMMTLEENVVFNFYNINPDKLADKSCYVSSSGATAEEVSVFKVKDAADIQLVKDAIAERIEDKKIAFENYVPEEMVKINNAVTYVNGSYVIVAFADDISPVEKTFNQQF